MAHAYLSTACLHAFEPGRQHLHKKCQANTTGDGKPKKASTCKFCDAKCLCPCHLEVRQ